MGVRESWRSRVLVLVLSAFFVSSATPGFASTAGVTGFVATYEDAPVAFLSPVAVVSTVLSAVATTGCEAVAVLLWVVAVAVVPEVASCAGRVLELPQAAAVRVHVRAMICVFILLLWVVRAYEQFLGHFARMISPRLQECCWTLKTNVRRFGLTDASSPLIASQLNN